MPFGLAHGEHAVMASGAAANDPCMVHACAGKRRCAAVTGLARHRRWDVFDENASKSAPGMGSDIAGLRIIRCGHFRLRPEFAALLRHQVTGFIPRRRIRPRKARRLIDPQV